MKSSEEDKKAVGKRFREVRKKAGLNQVEFADKLGCGRSNVSLIEAGINMPGGGLLIALRSKLNISLDWLFFGEGEMFFDDVKRNLELLDFQDNTWEVKGMLEEMKSSRQVMHRVLSDFLSYMGSKTPSVIINSQSKKKE